GPTTIKLRQRMLADDIAQTKEQIRSSMNFERWHSLRSNSVRDFVSDMERPRSVNGEEQSIFSLIADGRALHHRLDQIRKHPNEERVFLLKQVVKPYLQ